MEKSDLPREYAFGTYRLVRKPNRLLQGDEPISLAQRALMVLTVLVERAGDIVSRDELFDTVWRDRLVEPGNLDVQLSMLRSLLGRELIQTVPGRGYRIAVTVTVGGTPLVAASSQSAGRPAAPDRTNLPSCLTPLIGRDAELQDLAERVIEQRLVTIAGPGGVGKTQLALAIGERRTGDFADGVWLIDLAPLTDPALIASATATVLGVALQGIQRPVDAIVAAIAEQRRLLIFDNCEYLAAAAADLIQTLLDRVAGISVLVTSQEILRLPAETIYRLDPLALPPETADSTRDADEIARYGAVELFVTRAQAADRRFRLDAGNAALVASICRDLEGLPLALEMAAARSAMLGVKGLHQRLGERLAMLAARSRTGEARHRTLLAMVEWSHGLLDASDRQVFRRLAVFRGGFSLEAATAVAGADNEEPWATVDALQRLIDKSLVTADSGETPRYRLLETLRLFAAQALGASGESETIAERHVGHFIEFFDGADTARQGKSESEWRRVYLPEIDNVRAGLDWALADPARKQKAIALAATTASLWDAMDLHAEGKSYLDRAECLLDRTIPDADVARLLSWIGRFWIDWDRPRASAVLERAVAIYRPLNQKLDLFWPLTQIGYVYIMEGRHAEARAILCEAEDILSAADYKKPLSGVLSHLGFLASRMDENAEARRYFSRAVEVSRAAKDARREGFSLIYLAEFEFKMGAVDVAIARARDAVSALRDDNHRLFFSCALANLASYLVTEDKFSEARPFAEEALSLMKGKCRGIVVLTRLQLWALLSAAEGRYEAAARLAGYVDAGYAACGESREPTEQYLQDRLAKFLADNLSLEIILVHRAEGARWSEGQAVTFAYDSIISPGAYTGGC